MHVHSYSTLQNPMLGAGLVAGPAAWAIDLNLRYFWIEAQRTELVAYFVALGATAIAIAGAVVCFRFARHPRPAKPRSAREVRHFVALGGGVLNVFFAIVIMAAAIPHLFLGIGD